MTDASKHCGLGRTPEVKGAQPRVVNYASLPIMINTYPVLEVVMILSDGSEVIFNAALEAAIQFWRTAEGFPEPPATPRPRAP